jgi:hypothetical protein
MKDPITLRGFKLHGIADRLAIDILRLLRVHLTKTKLRENELCADLLLLLNREPYVNELLFRDFKLNSSQRMRKCLLPNGTVKNFHVECFVYLRHVLVLHRMTLANNLKDKPGNLHLLFEALCRYSEPVEIWQNVSVKRIARTSKTTHINPDFATVANKLQAACDRLGDDFSGISKRRRKEYGALHLCAGNCTTEMPEEMALLEMLKILPLPLRTEFANDEELQKCLSRVVDALNTRYKWLRACGLNPEKWLEREYPSIQNLKDITKLRKHITEHLAQKGGDFMAVARQLFELLLLQSNQKKFAGFPDFDTFSAEKVGREMLGLLPISLNQAQDVLAKDAGESPDNIAIRDEENQLFKAWIENLQDDYPKFFDPIMAYFFQEVLAKGIPVGGEVYGLLEDKAFQQLLAKDRRYANLTKEKQADELVRQAIKIIEKGKKQCNTS